jgi:hypothetical protein
MPDAPAAPNNTIADAASIPTPPSLSESNWPGDKAAATPAAGDGNKGADGAATAATKGEGAAAEGEGGQAGEGGAAAASGEDAPAGDGSAAADTGPQNEPGAAVKPDGKRDRSLSGKLSAKTREVNEVRAERDQLAGLLEKAIDRLGGDKPTSADGTAAKTGAAAEPPPDPRPQRAAFEDPDAYDAAVDDWNSRNTRRVVQAEIERRGREDQQRQQNELRDRDTATRHQAAVTRFNQRRAELEAKPEYADFAEVAFAEDLTIPVGLTPILVESDPLVLYHLGTNREVAAELAALTTPGNPAYNPAAALKRVGALEDRLLNARPQMTRTPAPPRPLNGGSNRAVEKDPSGMTMEEYAAWRDPKLKAERRNTMFGNRN